MIQGVVTTQPTVGWVVEWPLAWLLTYSGFDCGLWRYVHQKCTEAELCREAASLLPTIGYDLTKHKCLHP